MIKCNLALCRHYLCYTDISINKNVFSFKQSHEASSQFARYITMYTSHDHILLVRFKVQYNQVSRKAEGRIHKVKVDGVT